MLTKEDIVKAIGEHIWWKQEFAKAIMEGRYLYDPDQLERDDEAELGRFLYGLAPADQTSEHFKTVLSLNAIFHEEVAHIARLALDGEVAAAESRIGVGLFSNVSVALIAALRAWMETVESADGAAYELRDLPFWLRTEPKQPSDPSRPPPPE